MKMFGKYVKRPKEAEEKQPEVKSTLLQTYLTSLLCLVLCVTMFFGTSFAWFTSEVNNTANEIYIGTLDVDLFKESKENKTELLNLASNDTNTTNTTKLFDGDIRWEPGYTTLETIHVVNNGDLAFKYVLNFTDGKFAEDSKQSNQTIKDVAEHFDVWVYKHSAEAASVPTPGSYEAITAAESGWDHAGSLDQLLAGEPVLEGVMVTVRNDKLEAKEVIEGTTDGVATDDVYTIALHMKEEANEAVMGHKISLNVKLVAYQMASEEDAFGDAYDQMVATREQLAEALESENSGTVALASGIEISSAEERLTMNCDVLDGNKKIINYTANLGDGPSLGVVNTSGGIVRNLTIQGGEAGRALYVTKLTSDLVVSDCTLSGAYAFNLNSSDATTYNLTFTKTIFESWTSYANVMSHANFTDCTFEDVLRPYGDTTLTNCIFTKESLDVSELIKGETITLVNCTYNGVSGVNAVLTATENGQVNCNNGTLTISNGKIVAVKSDQ